MTTFARGSYYYNSDVTTRLTSIRLNSEVEPLEPLASHRPGSEALHLIIDRNVRQWQKYKCNWHRTCR
jgi:hypothetical protein